MLRLPVRVRHSLWKKSAVHVHGPAHDSVQLLEGRDGLGAGLHVRCLIVEREEGHVEVARPHHVGVLPRGAVLAQPVLGHGLNHVLCHLLQEFDALLFFSFAGKCAASR